MAVETTPSTDAATEMMQTLPGSAYLSYEHFAREAEAIFHREWFQVGREESIPTPGDYLHVEVAGESVVVVRSRDGELRGFYNVCRHRGSRLVMEDPERSATCRPRPDVSRAPSDARTTPGRTAWKGTFGTPRS